MNARHPLPPYLLGAALLFWGLHSGNGWVGLALAALAEWPRLAGWRWRLSIKEFQRLADLCSALVVIAAVALYLDRHLAAAAMGTVRWGPALLFPLLAAQLYSATSDGPSGVPLSALFWSLRGKSSGERRLDLRYPYLVLTLLAAAMVEGHTPWYYPAVAALALWGLWPVVGRRRAAVLLFVAAAAGGYGVSLGLQATQRAVGDRIIAWLMERYAGDRDPFRATTAIGEIGELKGSERILLRVWPEAPLRRPLLLRTAVYNRYLDGTWYASREAFARLPRVADRWELGPDARETRRVALALFLNDGEGILPLPGGTSAVVGLPGADLSRNSLGAVKVLEGPELAELRARFDVDAAGGSPPGNAEFWVPAVERPVLEGLVAQLGLAELPPAGAVERLERFFIDEFRYSLRLPGAGEEGEGTPLTRFLTEGRSGHCEYFATATTLLLRAAGVPSRYVVGWSVQERTAEGGYVARARHAHAWSQVWLGGAWRDLDTTPPDWSALEAEAAPWWAGWLDRWSEYRFRFARWRAGERAAGDWLAWLLPPLVVVLGWRLARQRRVVTARGEAVSAAGEAGLFSPVERRLEPLGRPRRPGESLRRWLDRLEREAGFDASSLRPLLERYYRLRFDPAGAERREALEEAVIRWREAREDETYRN